MDTTVVARRARAGAAALPSPRRARLAGRPRPADQGGGRGHLGRWLLRSGRQLRGGAWALRRVGRGGRDEVAAGRTRGRAGRDAAGRRLLLPHPAGPPGRPVRAAHRGAARVADERGLASEEGLVWSNGCARSWVRTR